MYRCTLHLCKIERHIGSRLRDLYTFAANNQFLALRSNKNIFFVIFFFIWLSTSLSNMIAKTVYLKKLWQLFI